ISASSVLWRAGSLAAARRRDRSPGAAIPDCNARGTEPLQEWRYNLLCSQRRKLSIRLCVAFRFMLPVQPVGATPSDQLIRQWFPIENPTVRLDSIRPSQGGVPFESTLATDLSGLGVLL